MKVKELIRLLRDCNPEEEVLVEGMFWGHNIKGISDYVDSSRIRVW